MCNWEFRNSIYHVRSRVSLSLSMVRIISLIGLWSCLCWYINNMTAYTSYSSVISVIDGSTQKYRFQCQRDMYLVYTYLLKRSHLWLDRQALDKKTFQVLLLIELATYILNHAAWLGLQKIISQALILKVFDTATHKRLGIARYTRPTIAFWTFGFNPWCLNGAISKMCHENSWSGIPIL